VIPALTQRAFRLLSAAPVPGALAEFGVYQGGGLVSMARHARQFLGYAPPLYGFDTFQGMPPSDVEISGALARYWAQGTFSDTSIEQVRARLESAGVDATLVPGRFSEIGSLASHGIDKVMLAHIDADLYEGYHDALELLTPHLQVGSVLLFDESIPPNEWSAQSIRDHGQRAVREWEDKTGLNLHLIRYEWTVALCVVVDEDYLRANWLVIDDLRKDTVTESLKNIAKKVLRRPRELRAF
jgi:O-methyltransferase